MTLAKARLASLARMRNPANLRAVARALLIGNERDQRRAREFADKATRMERASWTHGKISAEAMAR